jgi:hypothetical protein
MSGSGSGRHRTRNVGALTAMPRIDMRVLRRGGLVRPGSIVTGILTWSRYGVAVGEAAVRVDLAEGHSGVLTVAFGAYGDVHPQEVAIASRPLRYGGRRYYFKCPETEKLCEVLALVDGVFASRAAQRLAYPSQSDDGLGRLHRRVEGLRAQLWPDSRGRPRGRNRHRIAEAWVEASIQLDKRLEAALNAIAALDAGLDKPAEAFGLGRRQWPAAAVSRGGRPGRRRRGRSLGPVPLHSGL